VGQETVSELEESGMHAKKIALHAGALILIFMLYGCDSNNPPAPPDPPPPAADDLVWDQGAWDEVIWT
jgi:hypothetical protein